MKKTNYKLQVKRSTLSNLSQTEMDNLKGGAITTDPINPSNYFTCQSHLYTDCCFNTRFLCVTRFCPIQPL
jgi:natural product precursor